MGVANPEAWGPHAWHFLHSIAETYRTETKEEMKTFMASLPNLLPCTLCSVHLQEYLNANPVEKATRSQEAMSTYMWQLHNKVNERLGKSLWPGKAPRVNNPCEAEGNLTPVLVVVVLLLILCVALLSISNRRR